MYDGTVDPQEYERVHFAEERHFWYRGLHALALAQLDRAIGSRNSSVTGISQRPRVLDAGCGAGGFTTQVAARAAVIGIDFSPLALGFTARRGLTRLARASIEAIPLADASVDAAVSLDVLYHSAVRDDLAALRELRRVVRPGGSILLNLPAHPWLRSSHDAMIHGARRYSKARLREMARLADLEIVRLGYWNSTLFPALALFRLAIRNRPAASDVSIPPAPINALLSALLRFEAWLFQWLPLTPGLSLFAVFRRPLGA